MATTPSSPCYATAAITTSLGLSVTGLELPKGSTLSTGETGTSVGRVLERAPGRGVPNPDTGTDRHHEAFGHQHRESHPDR